jgi:nucleotide-binding universal stress UspA family protein
MNAKPKTSCTCSGHGCRAKAPAFKRILVAVDSSPQAEFAVGVANQMASRLRANVLLLNVTSVAYLPYVNLAYITNADLAMIEPEFRAATVEASHALLERLKLGLPDVPHVEIMTREGDPPTEILNIADAYSADLIIMGTHARGPIAQAILGSTAHAVTQRSSCPVMTVSRGLANSVSAKAAAESPALVAS